MLCPLLGSGFIAIGLGIGLGIDLGAFHGLL
jgi:hypothetical protein